MRNISFVAWAEVAAALIAAFLVVAGCRPPRKPPPTEGSTNVQTRRQAMERSPEREEPPHGVAPAADVECILSMTLDGSQLDCTFSRCPLPWLAELLGSQDAFLDRVHEDQWRIQARNDTPPFLPESRLVLVSGTGGWSIEPVTPQEDTPRFLGTCQFAGEDLLSGTPEKAIPLRRLTFQRRMGAR